MAKYQPRSILLSKRAHVAYVEFARVMVKNERVVYLTESGEDIEQFFNIPYQNCALLLLGKGTSITNSAMRMLAGAQVMVGFSGSGGAPLLHSVDVTFSAPQSEYRPTEYMQEWMRMWLDEPRRLEAAKRFMRERTVQVARHWGRDAALADRGVDAPSHAITRLTPAADVAKNTTELMAAEAVFARELYSTLARSCKFEFRREEGKGAHESIADLANGFLDHGNYIAYGFAAVALHALGISFALPVLHGKTRRGALVFDVADIIKDALVMPTAFICAAESKSEQEFRTILIERCQTAGVIDTMIETIQIAMKK